MEKSIFKNPLENIDCAKISDVDKKKEQLQRAWKKLFDSDKRILSHLRRMATTPPGNPENKQTYNEICARLADSAEENPIPYWTFDLIESSQSLYVRIDMIRNGQVIKKYFCRDPNLYWRKCIIM